MDFTLGAHALVSWGLGSCVRQPRHFQVRAHAVHLTRGNVLQLCHRMNELFNYYPISVANWRISMLIQMKPTCKLVLLYAYIYIANWYAYPASFTQRNNPNQPYMVNYFKRSQWLGSVADNIERTKSQEGKVMAGAHETHEVNALIKELQL